MRNNERDNEIKPSEKHIPLRIIGFVLAFITAVCAFSFGVTRIGYKQEGMYELTAAADQELPLYQSGVHAKLLFRGSSSQIKLALGQADKLYTEVLKRNVKLLDARQEYDGMVNLAALNAHPNEDIELSPELFAVLQDAWTKTREGQGYSLFAGPVYAEWNSILNLTEPEEFDPLGNEEEAARLERLRQRIRENGPKLVTVDEQKCILRLELPADYRAFLEDMELEPAYLDLNLLREAYLLELVAAELEEQGLNRGFLSTDSGLILSLSGLDKGEYALYGAGEKEPVLVASAQAAPGSAYSLMTAFPLVTGVETPYYAIEEAGRTHLRNPWLPSDGEDRELLLSSCVIREDGALAEACYENLRLRCAEHAAELEKLAGESDAAVAWLLQGDESGTVYRNASAEGTVLPKE